MDDAWLEVGHRQWEGCGGLRNGKIRGRLLTTYLLSGCHFKVEMEIVRLASFREHTDEILASICSSQSNLKKNLLLISSSPTS